MDYKDKIKGMLEKGFTKEEIMNYRFLNEEIGCCSLDDYLKFLNDLQKIFGPFPVSDKITKTELNKL